MILRSPLHEVHKELGAKFTEFVGFKMPLQFSSIKQEHIAVRRSVGLFDVSHMSNIWIDGRDAEKLLGLATVEDASRIVENSSQYTVILKEDGTVIDDTIFMNLGSKYMMVPNAGMSSIVAKWLKDKAKEYNLDVDVKDVSKEYVILAIQGPKSRDTLQKLTNIDLNTVKFFGC